ncbi:FlaA1/EpsC-like NDP-sugar epimerase [Friedmanniella endophytica]|uniref:FlaA1/EpsC-like NDP-sugar epimerase n=1 Tax=Microlunatus kandeliicorticis TaxID=1759536 RepID=A0A7W3ITQ5_9ACTN|nr:DUF3054 domain-containing protein [Microlunatus kandeliicorticis]MBA8795062.1 FlaA1/EpsC-like NDP-sugar epimerase [Microlunatus kandeliicorticis]
MALRAARAAAVDVIVVLFFALVGRHAHDESGDVVGVVVTAWPFLVGTLVGSLVARTWRSVTAPTATRTALIVWVSTVLLGMVLRVLSGSTAQWSFVLVATVVLGVLLVGWRVAARATRRARRRIETRMDRTRSSSGH